MDPDAFARNPNFDPTWWTFAHVAAGALSLLFWLALLGLAVWAFTRLTTPTQTPTVESGPPTAMDLLRQRYVLGEIDATTFEEMVERVMASEAWERSGGTYRGRAGRGLVDRRPAE
jgi:hypothetical protein